MILYLEGHDFRYAVEQCQLVFFPDDRPVFYQTEPPSNADAVRSRLSFADCYATAVTTIRRSGSVFRGIARTASDGYPDRHDRKRSLTHAVKLSFYRAAVSATGSRPPWGALTGIRPAGLIRALMREGVTFSQANRMLRDRFDVSPQRADLCRSAAGTAVEVERGLSKNDISLYIGIPFCPTRCAYCTFVSHAITRAGHLLPAFLEALVREIEAVGVLVKENHLHPMAVYIGGGTPTTLSAEQLGSLAEKIHECFDMSNIREFTVEAGRPDTITMEKLDVLRRYGVTRVSVNPQSLRETVLAAAGRPHSAADALRAYGWAADAGFQVNTDLIAGLPGDTPDGFAQSLDRILALRPDNITLHTLARKKGSALTLNQAPLPASDAVGDMLTYAYGCLRDAGYRCYYLYRQKFMAGPFENTGWSRPGGENLYNVCMMEELRSALSMGGGGVSKLVDPSRGLVERVFNPKYPYEYLSRFDDMIRGKEKIRTFYRNMSNL